MNLDDVMSELRVEYLESFEEKVKKLAENFKAGSLNEIELEFHKMKGTGQTYGIDEISTLGMVMERLCQNHPNKLGDTLEDAIELINQIVASRSNNEAFPLEENPKYLKLLNESQ